MSRMPVFHQIPGVVFQPTTHLRMQKGINQLVDAIRPTLGPCPRLVAVKRFPAGKAPELLDNGAVIARRILDLPDRDENVGAMFLRGLLWRLHEQVGDGTATAAVLFQSIYNQGIRYITSGGNAMRLRHYLEEGMRAILDMLSGMVIPVEGKEELARVASAICYDIPLARMLGEIFDIIGEHGWLDIRAGRGRELEREYVEGSYWPGGVLSRGMITDHTTMRVRLEEAAVLITDLEIDEPQQLVPIITATAQTGIRALLILANRLSDGALALLMTSRDRTGIQLVAVKLPGLTSSDQAAAMEDLAVLTGGRPFLKAAGDTLQHAGIQDMGHARRAWADHTNFGIAGGQGDPRALREHIARLREVLSRVKDAASRTRLQQRIGKLIGGSAILWVGGATESEIAVRQELARRTSDALRGAVSEGVLYGGGVSLLNCRPMLRDMLARSTDPDQRAAYQILLRAMEVPIRTIVTNSGHDAGRIMADVERAGPGYGFDAISGHVVDMMEAGILDVATVQKAALHSAISGAALALTVDILIHRRRLGYATEPD